MNCSLKEFLKLTSQALALCQSECYVRLACLLAALRVSLRSYSKQKEKTGLKREAKTEPIYASTCINDDGLKQAAAFYNCVGTYCNS